MLITSSVKHLQRFLNIYKAAPGFTVTWHMSGVTAHAFSSWGTCWPGYLTPTLWLYEDKSKEGCLLIQSASVNRKFGLDPNKQQCAVSTQDHPSPAVVVWPDSIKACVLLEGIPPALHDEVGVPVQTLLPLRGHTHHAAIKLSVLLVTVTWTWRHRGTLTLNGSAPVNSGFFYRGWRSWVLSAVFYVRTVRELYLPTSQNRPVYPSGQKHWKEERLGPFMQEAPFWQGLGLQEAAVNTDQCLQQAYVQQILMQSEIANIRLFSRTV